MKQFRGGLVFKAHRLVYHSTLGLRVIKKKKKKKKTGFEPRLEMATHATPTRAPNRPHFFVKEVVRGFGVQQRRDAHTCYFE